MTGAPMRSSPGRLDLLANAGALREAAAREARVMGLSREDSEDVAQDAYATLLVQCGRGYEAHDPRGLIKRISRRAAIKKVERQREQPFDPDAPLFVAQAEVSGVDEAYASRVDLATAAEALAQLGEGQRRAYKLKLERTSWQRATKVLGCSKSQYFERAKLAGQYVGEALAGENRAFNKATRLLINAFVLESESLSADERRRARRLIERDPHAAALARELRRGHEALGAALPPVAVHESLEPGIFERLGAGLGKLRDQVSGAFGSGREGAEAAATQAMASGGTRGAGAAGAGGIAGLLGAGGAKIAAICGGAAATVACVAVVAPDVLPGGDNQAEAERAPAVEQVRNESGMHSVETPALLPVQVERAAAAEPEPNPKAEDDGGGDADGSEPAPAPEPVVEETAPASTQQFGVEAAATPATGPAPADTNDSDGASAGTVRQEFGP